MRLAKDRGGADPAAAALRHIVDIVQPNTPPKDRIFVIGPNKCGTSSLHHFFRLNGLKSGHWRVQGQKNLAQVMQINHALARRPFEGYEDFHALSDISFNSKGLTIDGFRQFALIHRAYPDAFFILNHRPRDKWLASRRRHPRLMERVMEASGLEEAAVLAGWAAMYEAHLAEVRAHFAGHPRFLDFAIESETGQTLSDFLSPAYRTDPALWEQRNATARPPDAAGSARAARL